MDLHNNEKRISPYGVSDAGTEMILSDQKEALSALALDQEFVEHLLAQKTLKGMQSLFKNRGVILSAKEIDDFIEMVKAFSTKQALPDQFFENAAAGFASNTGAITLASKMAETVNSPEPSIRPKLLEDSVFWL